MTVESPFKVHAELEAFEKADDPEGRTMWIGGIVSTDKLDKQDERVLATGLDFSPFIAEGWFNDNHGQRTVDVLGYPTDARYVRKGDRLPSGSKADRSGWYAEGYLLNTEEGRRVYSLAQSLHKSPRKLGFSIEGKVVSRDRRNRNVVTSAVVKNVAITHCPVNTDTEMHVLAKALTAGSAIGSGDLNQGPGDGGALRVESLEGSPNDQGGKKRKKADEEPEDGTLSDGPRDDPNNGGVAGVDMHKADGDEFELEVIDEDELFDRWLPALQAGHQRMSASVSKSEAEMLIRSRFPHITDDGVREIIQHASGGKS